VSNVKNIKFSVKKMYVDKDELGVYIKRASHKNVLYIYVYQRGIFKDHLLLAIKVVVHERGHY
jgi:hypothetical protein